MNEVLLFFILKYKGDWLKIYKALEDKEKVSIEDLISVRSKIKSDFISIIKDDYPKLLKQIYKPPFGLFTIGNSENLNNEKITLIGDFKYENLLPIINQGNNCAIITKIKKSNLTKIKMLARKGFKLILISEEGIQNALNNMKELLKYDNVLIISEHYQKNGMLSYSQPSQRILMGLSYSAIINYDSNIDDINLTFEISKQESVPIYNFSNCPKKMIKKYGIKSIDECPFFNTLKN